MPVFQDNVAPRWWDGRQPITLWPTDVNQFALVILQIGKHPKTGNACVRGYPINVEYDLALAPIDMERAVLPKLIAQFGQELGARTREDHADAVLVANPFAEMGTVPGKPPPPPPLPGALATYSELECAKRVALQAILGLEYGEGYA